MPSLHGTTTANFHCEGMNSREVQMRLVESPRRSNCHTRSFSSRPCGASRWAGEKHVVLAAEDPASSVPLDTQQQRQATCRALVGTLALDSLKRVMLRFEMAKGPLWMCT